MKNRIIIPKATKKELDEIADELRKVVDREGFLSS